MVTRILKYKVKIPKKYQLEHVCCLPEEREKMIMTAVKKAVSKLLLTNEEKQEAVENANLAKICDLEDLIHIEYI